MEGSEIRAHVGVVALLQVLVSIVTVAVAFAFIRADVDHLLDWSKRHEAAQDTFVRNYHDSNLELSKAVSGMEAKLEALTTEIRELRRERRGGVAFQKPGDVIEP